MKQIIVNENEAGQRLDRLLGKYMKKAPESFLHKMLRKKNIKLNGSKAAGGEKVQAGDEITLYFSDETWEKFAGTERRAKIQYPTAKLKILYEDRHILLVDKPQGMLSQKAQPSDVSLNEYVLGYLQRSGQWDPGQSGWKPSVCNRLDRNTSGIVVCGKTAEGLRQMSEVLRERTVHKYYQCVVAGRVDEARHLKGYLWKDPEKNKVEILPDEREGALPVETEYRPIRHGADWTLLEILLITGRSHQIRAHLAQEGHPVIGDPKYGDHGINAVFRKRFGVQGQLLHACRLEFPEMREPLQALSGKIITSELPERMQILWKDTEKET